MTRAAAPRVVYALPLSRPPAATAAPGYILDSFGGDRQTSPAEVTIAAMLRLFPRLSMCDDTSIAFDFVDGKRADS